MQAKYVLDDAIAFNQKELQSRKENSGFRRNLFQEEYLKVLSYLSEHNYPILDVFKTEFYDEFNEYYDMLDNVVKEGAPEFMPNHRAIDDLLFFQHTRYDAYRLNVMQKTLPFTHVFMVEIFEYEQHPEDIPEYLEYNIFHATLINATNSAMLVLESHNDCEINEVKYQDNRVEFIGKGKVLAVVRCINKHDFWKGSEVQRKRISTALKGLSFNSTSKDIKENLHDFRGIASAQLGFHPYCDSKLFVPLNNTINDYVTMYRQIIEALTGIKPSLSEARNLYLQVKDVSNWHSLKASEKKHDTECYIAIEISTPPGWDGDDYTYLGTEGPSPSIIDYRPIASLADVYLYMDNYLRDNEGSIKFLLRTEGLPCLVTDNKRVIIKRSNVVFDEFDDPNKFKENFDSPEILDAVMKITQYIDKGAVTPISFNIKNSLALNCIYQTEINGYRLYVEDNTYMGYLSPTIRIETDDGDATAETCNLCIGKSKQKEEEFAMFRYSSEERCTLTHLGDEGIKMFLTLLGYDLSVLEDCGFRAKLKSSSLKNSVIGKAIEKYNRQKA